MRTVRNLSVPMLLLLATPLLGQGGWAAAKCGSDLKPNHYLVNSGLLYLKSATSARFDDQKRKDLADAQRTLTQALTTGGQDKNPAAWYYLGRYYVLTNDAQGMDSAFSRTLALKPDCKDDIAGWRRVLWVPVFNAGVAAWQANNTDSAINSFRRAVSLMPNDPTGFKYLATLYYNGGQQDSAVAYFRKAVDVSASDPKFAQDHKDALFNLGRIQQSMKRLPDAQATYTEYLKAYPNDPEVLTALGTVLMDAGNKDSAFAIYKQIIAHGDSMGYFQLYRVGAEISQSVPEEPDTSTAGSSCRSQARAVRPALTVARVRARCDSVTSAAAKAYTQSAREAFSLAAQALDASLKINPYNREALIFRANTALGMHDSAVALDYSRKLLAVDPMNRTAIRIMAFAQQQNGKVDSTLHYLRLGDSTLVGDVAVGQFDSTDTGRDVKVLVTNPRATANAPYSLVFEFVDLHGQVVDTQTITVPAIEPGQSQSFELKAKGPSIAAWRYHKG